MALLFTLATVVDGIDRFLSVGKKTKNLPGFNNHRNIYTCTQHEVEESNFLTKGASAGHAVNEVSFALARPGFVFIELWRGGGKKGHLVPTWGNSNYKNIPGRGLLSDDGDGENDMWEYVWFPSGQGFHFKLYNTSLYLGITDGFPTLSATPVVWKIQEDARDRLVRARAEKLWQEGGGDEKENWHMAERSCFD